MYVGATSTEKSDVMGACGALWFWGPHILVETDFTDIKSSARVDQVYFERCRIFFVLQKYSNDDKNI
jgi:hypothetical protein